jgi:signal transduction histidine kinase
VHVFFEKVYPDEEYRKKIASEVLDGINSGDPEKMHWEGVRITRKDGEQRYVNAKNIPLPGQNLMISTVMDVTRKKKDEELILYKSSLLAAIAKAGSMLLRYDDWFATIHEMFEIIGEAVQADRVYYFENFTEPETGQYFTNQKVEWSRDDIEPQINNPVWQNVSFEAFDRFLDPLTEQEIFQSLTKELPEGDFKIEIQNQDILSLLVIPIFVQEKFWGFIGFDDCTAERTWTNEEVSFLKTITGNLANAIEKYQSGQTLKKLNKVLEVRARELAVSNAELEEFAFVVSHDLQEPLRMVRSFMNLLERRYEDKLDDRAKKYIHFAADGAKRMQQIILDLLEFSRVGQTDTEMSDVDIDALLYSSVQFCRRIIKEKSADVSWGKMPVITAAKNPLQQVFQNLLNNALIYQPKENKPRVVIRAEETDTHWQFEIEDNGIGIHEDNIETIFNIFHRLHTDDTFEGTGIGLAICKKIIEHHGGTIWVESVPGKGSIFYFTIIK